jgi:hypothetical protein
MTHPASQICVTCHDEETVLDREGANARQRAANRLTLRCAKKGHVATSQYRMGGLLPRLPLVHAPEVSVIPHCPSDCEGEMTRHVDMEGPFWRCPECLYEWDDADLS